MYKAADTLLRLCKVLGWVGAEQPDNFWQTLTQADLDAIKERVKAMPEAEVAKPKTEPGTRQVN